MSIQSKTRQTDRNRRYTKTTKRKIKFLGDYKPLKDAKGYVRAFGPGTRIKSADGVREYRVALSGAFIRLN